MKEAWNNDRAMTSEEIEATMERLERYGLVRKNGVFRPNRYGVMKPVYVSVPEEELSDRAKRRLKEIGSRRAFESQ